MFIEIKNIGGNMTHSYLTIDETSKMLCISRQAIQQHIRSGNCRCIQATLEHPTLLAVREVEKLALHCRPKKKAGEPAPETFGEILPEA